MDKYELRRLRLIDLKDRYCEGKIARLAERLERAPSYVSRMLYPLNHKYNKKIGDDMVDVIAEAFDFHRSWLDDDTLDPAGEELITGLKEVPLGYYESITPAPAPRGIIPVISLVQAGAWAEIVDNFEPGTAEEWVPSFGNHSKHAFAVRVEGISMQNHGHKESFDPGDIVLVDPDLPADNGALVIVRLDDRNEATFKKLHIEGTEKYLVPLNPNWPEKIIPINGNATICGVVYQKIVKF